jgi:hypothetical protein
MIILPRQARDKHRESSAKSTTVFLQAAGQVTKSYTDLVVRKPPFLSHSYIHSNEHFAKTGSGQTQTQETLRNQIKMGFVLCRTCSQRSPRWQGCRRPRAWTVTISRRSLTTPPRWYQPLENALFGGSCLIELAKAINLPRQARDKHGKS